MKIQDTQTIEVKPCKKGLRVWIEGARLSRAGFNKGARYTRNIQDGLITITLDDAGKYKTSGHARRGQVLPIIDWTGSKLDSLQAGDKLHVAFYDNGMITLRRMVELRRVA